MDIRFVTTQFGDFAYEDSGPKINHPCYLLLHGGAANLRAWDAVVEHLSVKARCVAIDLPAHGKTPIAQLGFEDLCDALVELGQQLSIDNPILLGHSFGALVAATTAEREPSFAAAVIAVDPYLNSKEIKRNHKSLDDALSLMKCMDWPWRDTKDLEEEVNRSFSNYSKRQNDHNLRAMIRRGFRIQANGSYTRYPRLEDEMAGVRANWSIDVLQTFMNVTCPLAIAISSDPSWNHEKRKHNLLEIGAIHPRFHSQLFNCNHDIPGLMSDELSRFILDWTSALFASVVNTT